MTTFVLTMERRYRKLFIIEADTEEEAGDKYADGEHSGYWAGPPEIISVESMSRDEAQMQFDLFKHVSCAEEVE